ncbi:hypothetical protein BAE44_0012342 [Dichanthelium oligosanthes]|uniref:PGG domain-containing protein n=1 Tax=Dichanthelium oligosanthes TaxID=888268 RepID=A0A1E5VNC7_9POAL|nr:hypothetical protein BAE44_0012342 [Dichanthelium oligosanthes]
MAVAAANESEQAAAGEPTPTPATAANDRPVATLDPRLFMAACRGDSNQLKELLLLEEEEEEDEKQGTEGGATGAADDMPAVAAAHVVVEVDPWARPPDDAAPCYQKPKKKKKKKKKKDAAAPAPPSGSRSTPLLDGVTIEGDSLLHVVAARGGGKKFLRCAKMIVREKKRKGGAAAMRLVLEARNNKGDTPLHCAAGAGKARMISCLVDLAAGGGGETAVKELLRKQNQCGETALHQAVRATKNKKAAIDQLMAKDSELACIPHEEGASPLYLAISLGEMEIARHLFHTTKGKLSYSGPDGQNALHAAVSRGQALPMLLGWLENDLKAADMQGGQAGEIRCSAPAADLLWQLSSQRDKNGSTPLHLAASLGGWPRAGFLSKNFGHVWAKSRSATRLLLDANLSTAYQADNKGSYPIHAAAWSGGLGAVKMLLKRCPGGATLRDGRGRSFLHVAAEEGSYGVVEYVSRRPKLSSILNAQDNNGDTALHRAVHAGNVAVSGCLIRNRQVRLDVANKDGMTPLDLSCSMIPPGFDYDMNPRRIIELSLASAGAPHGGGRPEPIYEKWVTKSDEDKESEKLTEATQVMSIVAVLIATATFASAFALPGGYRADGDSSNHAGTPVLAGSYAFNAFILADALAFVSSFLATVTLVYAGVPLVDSSIRIKYFNIANTLVYNAGRSFVAALGLALYLVLAPVDRMIAVTVCAIIFVSLLWGNMVAWGLARVANTVRARIGVRQAVLRVHARQVCFEVLVHFGSYVIIFGLPAIRKWARVK